MKDIADIPIRPKVPIHGRIDKKVLRFRPEEVRGPRKKQRAVPGPRKGLQKNIVPVNPKHRLWVAGQPCCVPGCNHTKTQAAHINRGTHARSMKSPDEMTIPLCVAGARMHHDECDKNQQAFAERYDLDLVALAAQYAEDSPHV